LCRLRRRDPSPGSFSDSGFRATSREIQLLAGGANKNLPLTGQPGFVTGCPVPNLPPELLQRVNAARAPHCLTAFNARLGRQGSVGFLKCWSPTCTRCYVEIPACVSSISARRVRWEPRPQSASRERERARALVRSFADTQHLRVRPPMPYVSSMSAKRVGWDRWLQRVSQETRSQHACLRPPTCPLAGASANRLQ